MKHTGTSRAESCGSSGDRTRVGRYGMAMDECVKGVIGEKAEADATSARSGGRRSLYDNLAGSLQYAVANRINDGR